MPGCRLRDLCLLLGTTVLVGCSGSGTVPSTVAPVTTPPTTPAPVVVDALAGSVVHFGDSITCGAYADPLTNGYAFLLDPNFKGTANNFCRFGDMAGDMAWVQVYPHTNPQAPTATTSSPTYTEMIGTNDIQHCPDFIPGCTANYTATLYANLAWLAIPQSDKLFGQSTAIDRVGGWQPYDQPAPGICLSTTGAGDTLGFTVNQTLPGRHLYLAWHIKVGDGGSADLFLDGKKIDTLFTDGGTGASTLTQNNTAEQVFLRTYPLGALGPHTVSLRTNAGTATANSFGLFWAGVPSADYTLTRSPRVLAGGVLHFLYGGSDADTSVEDGVVQATVAALHTDGLDVEYVDTRDAVNPFTDMWDGVHPNATGHQKLAAAFLAPLEQ